MSLAAPVSTRRPSPRPPGRLVGRMFRLLLATAVILGVSVGFVLYLTSPDRGKESARPSRRDGPSWPQARPRSRLRKQRHRRTARRSRSIPKTGSTTAATAYARQNSLPVTDPRSLEQVLRILGRAGSRGGLPGTSRSWGESLTGPRRARRRSSSTSSWGCCTCRPASSSRRNGDSPPPRRPIPAPRPCSLPTSTPSGGSRRLRRGGRELRRLLQRGELHLPPGRLGQAPPDLRLTRGDPALHRLPPEAAGRHRGPLAVERGSHDPGDIPRRSPRGLPDTARAVPPDGERRSPDERRRSSRIILPRSEHGRRQPSSTTSRATAGLTSSPPPPTPRWVRLLRESRRRHVRGPLRQGRPGGPGRLPELQPC